MILLSIIIFAQNLKSQKIPSLDLTRLGRMGLAHLLSFSLSVLFVLKTRIIYSRDGNPRFLPGVFERAYFWEAHINKYNYVVKRLIKKCSGIITITEGLKNFPCKQRS